MERAAAGEEIAVTRRGNPTVRLVAHQPELRSDTQPDDEREQQDPDRDL